MIFNSEIMTAITKYSKYFDVNPDWIRAVIEIESAGNQFALRYEPGYRWLQKEDTIKAICYHSNYGGNLENKIGAETCLESFSFGLCQVMGSTARDMGYVADLHHLFFVDDNIRIGTKFLKTKLKRFDNNILRAIAAYNGGDGSAYPNEDGNYPNQRHVDRFLKVLENQ